MAFGGGFDPEVMSNRTARWGVGLPTTAGPAPRPGANVSELPTTMRSPLRRPRPPLSGPRDNLFGGYSAEQLTANPSLVERLGRHAAERWGARAPSGGAGPMPPGATGPMPEGPAVRQPGPPLWTTMPTPGEPPSGPPFAPGMGGNPMPGGFGPASGNEFLDPMMMFFSALPAMRLNTTNRISDAMAQAGGTGNRWGTSAQRTAGQIGAEAGMQENALLQGLLADYANQQESRALQATGQATGLGALLDQMAQSRIQVPFGVGAYEQGRQDDFSRQIFEDFQANRLGWLGPFLQAAMSQGAGSPGSPGQIINVPNNDSERGAVDWLTLLAGLFG